MPLNNTTSSLKQKLLGCIPVSFEAFSKSILEYCSEKNVPNNSEMEKVFNTFDKDKDGLLKQAEIDQFSELCMVEVDSALLVVDVQNDFIDGSLSLANGPAAIHPLTIIKPLNSLIKLFSSNNKTTVFTYDWHPKDHISFFENLKSRESQLIRDKGDSQINLFDTATFNVNGKLIKQKLWPTHCVQNTWGSQLYADVIVPKEHSWKLVKGVHANVDSYSAFFDNSKLTNTGLDKTLQDESIKRLFVCGLALDVCVADTCKDAAELGESYQVLLLEDCSCAFDHRAAQTAKMKLIEKGVIFLDQSQTMVEQILNVEKWKLKF